MASSTIEEAKLPGGYLVTPRVPQGLAATVEGLTREVIRHSPKDIYAFAAQHFEKLLEIREQCGVVKENSSKRDGRIDTLRGINRALREREFVRENAKIKGNTIDEVGWSLNQTAKVLKRHRSIFGEEGRKITTDEVFQMAIRNENHSRSPKFSTKKIDNRGKRLAKEKTLRQKADDVWKASTSRAEQSWSNEDSIEDNTDNTRMGPKIITQISNLPSGNVMLAKDIKTELRKNRMTSRERRNVRGRHEDKDTIEKSESNVVKSSGKRSASVKKSFDKQKKIETNMEERQSRKSNDSARSSSSLRKLQPDDKYNNRIGSRNNKKNSKTRTSSMDRVRDYAIEKFPTTKSLEELQTLNYVEKVQEIIEQTGPIIKDKIEQLKSGIIGGSEQTSWFDDKKKNDDKCNNDSSSEKSQVLSRQKDSPEISPSESTTNDALKTRLTEMRNVMENVSSSLTKSSGRSRSARSFRRSGNSKINDDSSTSEDMRVDAISHENRDSGLETKLSSTRDALEGISLALSKTIRRSSSATSLLKCYEATEDVTVNKDALKTRLDETRNLLKGISATFGKPTVKDLRNKVGINSDELFCQTDESLSKTSLPPVKSISVKNSSSGASRSESNNLVLPAISPEVPKSSKMKEDLILPILSSPSTASTNEDSSKIIDINDDVPLKDFGIPEIPAEDYIPEVPIDNVSRDSLNVTPDFDSIPQRPDSLEPVEPTNDLQRKTPEVCELKEKSTLYNELQRVDSEIDDLRAETCAVDDAETTSEVEKFESRTLELNDDTTAKLQLDLPRTETTDRNTVQAETSNLDKQDSTITSTDNLETKLQEIQKVEMDIDEIFQSQMKSDFCKSESSVTDNKQREAEDAEKRVCTVPDMDNHEKTIGPKELVEMPVEIIEERINPGETIEEEMKEEKDEREPGRADSSEEDDKSRLQDNEYNKLQNILPELENFTYVLTEGSPHDIPDTVTTVIIPERIVDSPLSNRLYAALDDGVEAKLSPELIEENSVGKVVEENIEQIDEDLVKPDIIDKARNNFEQTEKIFSPKSLTKMIHEDNSSSISLSDPFGELVRPEIITETSTDIDFIRDIENIQEMQISHQDLGPINEEVSEELEELENELDTATIMNDKVETAGVNEEDMKQIEIFEQEGRDSNDEKKLHLEIDESKIVESDLSPEGTRPSVCSESSNEMKESSAADEALESTKRENSINEEVSTETRTAESSNEVKETTLTDGLSLSLDSTRPYVPDLNLDSLQDITVSSFKMSEDDYENQERGESENTNSITDTLASDKNNCINDNREFMEDTIVEYAVSPSKQSELNEIEKETKQGEQEIVEDRILKRQVEVKEDICEKKSCYVTGPGGEESYGDNDEIEASEIEENKTEQKGHSVRKNIEEKSLELAYEDISIAGKNEDNTTKEEGKRESSNEKEMVQHVEIEKREREEINTPREEEEIGKMEESNESEDIKIVKDEKDKSETTTEAIEAESDQSLNEKKLNLDIPKNPEDRIQSSENVVCAKSETPDLRKKEETADDIDTIDLSSEEMLKNTRVKIDRYSLEYDEAEESNAEMQMEEEKSDDFHEGSYLDDETPLAVSRSASQCTTRRVSSGNLAKLRDNTTLEWTEEIEEHVEDSKHDPSSSKVKFSDAPAALDESNEGSQEANQNSSDSSNNDTNDSETTKEGKEYHIYVPEVDASGDNLTTESSSFDSAVTKIQAGVRGFLTRRRLRIERGQENRSSTLSSIPSIQDSIAIEPYQTGDRMHEESKDINMRSDKVKMASLKVSKNNDFVNAATRIQSNYRGYKARKHLRRENAVQRNTISLEKPFGESGLQHTGEFHDCIPLPIHDIKIEKKIIDLPIDPKEIDELDYFMKKETTENSEENESKTMIVKSSSSGDREKMFLSQSSSAPVVHFSSRPNVNQFVDIVVLAKNDDALQTGYLNFITSVEDTDAIIDQAEVSSVTKNMQMGEPNSRESLREPLALSDPPIGLIIQELNSSETNNFMKIDDDEDRTMASVNKSSLHSPGTFSAALQTVPKTAEDDELEKYLHEQFQVEKENTESKKKERCEDTAESEKMSDNVISDETTASSSNVEENIVFQAESMIDEFSLPLSLSSIQEKELLGPESCVDSIENSVLQTETGNICESSDLIGDETSPIRKVAMPMKKAVKEGSLDSNEDTVSSKLLFSMKVEDLLDLSSENVIELNSKKSISAVKLKSSDLAKSMGSSRESQLTDERIESPITMMQTAPERFESLRHDDLSEKHENEDRKNE